MGKKFVGQLLTVLLVCFTLAQIVIGTPLSVIVYLILVAMALYSMP